MSTLLKRSLLAALLLFLSAAGFGQAISGDLVGVVKDSTGAMVANATVDATNLQTGFKANSTTNSNGEYRFTNLPAGHYSVQAASGSLKGGYADIEVDTQQDANCQHYRQRSRRGNHGGSQRTSYHHRHHHCSDRKHLHQQGNWQTCP